MKKKFNDRIRQKGKYWVAERLKDNKVIISVNLNPTKILNDVSKNNEHRVSKSQRNKALNTSQKYGQSLLNEPLKEPDEDEILAVLKEVGEWE